MLDSAGEGAAPCRVPAKTGAVRRALFRLAPCSGSFSWRFRWSTINLTSRCASKQVRCHAAEQDARTWNIEHIVALEREAPPFMEQEQTHCRAPLLTNNINVRNKRDAKLGTVSRLFWNSAWARVWVFNATRVERLCCYMNMNVSAMPGSPGC